jgi:hypothetical protein
VKKNSQLPFHKHINFALIKLEIWKIRLHINIIIHFFAANANANQNGKFKNLQKEQML